MMRFGPKQQYEEVTVSSESLTTFVTLFRMFSNQIIYRLTGKDQLIAAAIKHLCINETRHF